MGVRRKVGGAAAVSVVAAAALVGAVPAAADDVCIVCPDFGGQANALIKIETGPGLAGDVFDKLLGAPAFVKLAPVFDKIGVEGPFWKW